MFGRISVRVVTVSCITEKQDSTGYKAHIEESKKVKQYVRRK
jgi:hypothetical protein